MIKSKREIKLLEKAAQITNSCIPLIEKSLKEKDITEHDLAVIVRKKINSQGATLAFQTLVASGERSSMVHPHPHASDKIISGIGFIDFGANYKGYKSDVTVPFIKGEASEKERTVVNTTFQSYKLAVKSVKVGMQCWMLHEMVDDFLRKSGFQMKHALGHGLGKKVHDTPIIGISRKLARMRHKLRGKRKRRLERIMKWTFRPNMVFTIEPGIYLKDFGCRVENDFILKNENLKALTKSRLIKA